MHVKGAAELLNDLAAAVVGVGPGKSLAAKVGAIQADLAANDTAGACRTLRAFIDEVNAQTGKKISGAVAASLISQARDIEAALGCWTQRRRHPSISREALATVGLPRAAALPWDSRSCRQPSRPAGKEPR